jgi:hypothetical protein
MEAYAWKSYRTTRLDLALDARKGKLMSPMSIIISRDGRSARKLEQTVIEQEEYLQQYIHAIRRCSRSTN